MAVFPGLLALSPRLPVVWFSVCYCRGGRLRRLNLFEELFSGSFDLALANTASQDFGVLRDAGYHFGFLIPDEARDDDA